MPSAGFQPATPATKRPQTYALDRAATEVGIPALSLHKQQARAHTQVAQACQHFFPCGVCRMQQQQPREMTDEYLNWNNIQQD
jgi:hypothetical protein